MLASCQAQKTASESTKICCMAYVPWLSCSLAGDVHISSWNRLTSTVWWLPWSRSAAIYAKQLQSALTSQTSCSLRANLFSLRIFLRTSFVQEPAMWLAGIFKSLATVHFIETTKNVLKEWRKKRESRGAGKCERLLRWLCPLVQ